MKPRRNLILTAVSAAAVATLLLSGCGGDDGDAGGGAGKAKGAPAADNKSGRDDKDGAAKPDSSTPKIDRPSLKLPSRMRVTFAKAHVSDPKQAAALGDAERYARAIVHGIMEQNTEDAAYKFYSGEGSQARKYAKSQIERHVSNKFSISGERSNRDAKVRPAAGKKGYAVTFCSDDNKLNGEDLMTKDTIRPQKTPKNIWYWQLDMVPSPDTKGLWVTDHAVVKAAAPQCR